jgi:hypothetical protein
VGIGFLVRGFSSPPNLFLGFVSVESTIKIIMENNDVREIRKVLCMHEEMNQANNSALMIISSKITELEQANATHSANIMSLLLLQKQRIDSLEVECNTLHSLILS